MIPNDRPTAAILLLGCGLFALSSVGLIWIKSIPIIYLLTSCGLIVLATIWYRRLPTPDPILTAILISLIVWCGMSGLWAINQEAAWSRTLKLLLMFVPALGLFSTPVLSLIRQGGLLPPHYWIIPGLLFVWLLLTSELLFGFPFHQWLGLPIAVSVYNEATSCFIQLAWPAGMYLWISGRHRAAIVLALATAILAFIGYSNTAMLAVIISVMVFVGARLWFSKLRMLIAVATVIVGLGMPWLISPLAMPARDLTANWLPASGLARLEIYSFIGQLSRERPLLGWGVESSAFLPLSPEYQPDLQYMPQMPLHPHNLFLELWVELGLVGILISLALLMLVLHRLDRLNSQAKPFALAAFACLMVIDLMAYSIWSGSLMGITITTAWLFCLDPPTGTHKETAQETSHPEYPVRQEKPIRTSTFPGG